MCDLSCATSDSAIYAIGEVAAIEGRCYGLVGPGYTTAEVVADRLLGGDAEFPGADLSTKLKLLGVDVASFGDALASTPGALEVVVSDPIGGTYAKLVLSDDAQTLLGGVLVGDASSYGVLRPLVGSQLPGDPVALIAPAGTGDGPAIGVGALPDDAQICSCNNVTKAALCSAIADGACTVADLKGCTAAGTSCGSCVPLLSQLLTAEGVEVSKALCEHFSQSRTELFEIVQASGVRTFYRPDRALRHRNRLRHLQAGGRVDPCLHQLRAHPRRRAGVVAGHQRPFPGQPATQRHLLGRAAGTRRRHHHLSS